MKRILIFITILSCLTVFSAKWTVAVYLDADNNLEAAGFDDFLEMAMVGSDANVNIVVQLDAYSTGNSYGWDTCKRFLVTNGMTPTSANAISDLGEVNMGDPATLVDFGKWVHDNYPADHYLLVLWDHGDGWRIAEPGTRGACTDDHIGDSTVDDYMNFSNGEIQGATAEITAYSGKKWDIIGYDVCLNQMWENNVASVADFNYFVASEMSEWGEGWTYNLFLQDLVSANGDLTPLQLSNSIVSAYQAGEGGSAGDTQSAVDLAYTPALTTAMNTFAKELMCARDGGYSTAIDTARNNCYEVDNSYYYDQIDLYDYCLKLEAQSIPASLNAASVAVRTAVTDCVTQNYAGSGIDCYGVAVYYQRPTSSYETAYDGTSINGTFWDNFLKGEGCPVPVLLSYFSNQVDDSMENGNGRAEPGETVDLNVNIANSGTDTATGISATLSSSDPYITILSNLSNYPDISSQTNTQGLTAFSFSVDAGCPEGYNAQFTLNITGDQDSQTETFSLTIGVPAVLLVDDDAGDSYESIYESAITDAGYSCETWEIYSKGSPALSDLQLHQCVVWTTGEDYSATLTESDEALLTNYLNAGGRLYFSSQDYLYDRGSESTFETDYLHVASYDSDKSPTVENGVTDDIITDGMSFSLSYPSGFSNYGDDITPDANAVTIFINSNTSNPSGLRFEDTYRIVFTAFDFAAVPDSGTAPNNNETVMGNILDWLINGSGTNLKYVSNSIDDSTGGNNNGEMDSGETVLLDVTLKNNGSDTATNITAILTTPDTLVTMITDSVTYPNFAPQDVQGADNPFSFSLYEGFPLDYSIPFTVSVTSDQGSWDYHLEFTVNGSSVMNTVCEWTVSTDTPITIEDNVSTGLTSVINIPEHQTIDDIKCLVDITHTYIGDLIVELSSPEGTTVRLHDRSLGTVDDILTNYDDDFSPDGPGTMDDFNGEDAFGDWTLFVSDNASGDSGTLNQWQLKLCRINNELELAVGNSGEGIFYPEWSWTNSPRKIAYIIRDTAGISNIELADSDGSGNTITITSADDHVSHLSQICWSPDDTYIVFASTATYGKLHLRRVAADGSEAGTSKVFQPLGNLGSPYLKWMDPHWSNQLNQYGDMERITVSISGDLWVYEPENTTDENSGIRRITDLSDPYEDLTTADKLYQPHWSPDNNEIVFTRRPPAPINSPANTNIYKCTGVQEIIAGSAYPIGDPDGDGIGGDWTDPRLVQISTSSYPEYSPSFSINGQSIGYICDSSNSFNNYSFWTDPIGALSSANFDAYCDNAPISGYDQAVNEGFMKWSRGGGDNFTYISESSGAYSLDVVHDETIGGFMKGESIIVDGNLIIEDNSGTTLEIPVEAATRYAEFRLSSTSHIESNDTSLIPLGIFRKITADETMIKGAFTPNAKLTIFYSKEELMGMESEDLELRKYINGMWIEVPSTINEDSDGEPRNDLHDGGLVSAYIDSTAIYGLFINKDSKAAKAFSPETVRVYPNPWKDGISTVDHIRIDSFGDISSLENVVIYNVYGEIIASLDSGITSGNSGIDYLDWNFVNCDGNPVASGIYFILLKSTDGEAKLLKAAVVK